MNDINKNLLHDPDTDASATINSGGELEVAVESLNPGTGATSLGKAEDAVHASGDTGVLTITVRRDSATQGAGTDGDYSVLITDANGRLHTLDANSAAIKTAVELIDDAISGNEMQVDIIASLPAGTNAIGKLAANSGVDIGDVDVTSTVLPTATVDTPEFFEDTSFVTGDSPVTLDINTALGRNATRGSIINDGSGNFTVAFSTDGAAFGDAITLKDGETIEFEGVSVDSLKVTWVSDSAYRVMAI